MPSEATFLRKLLLLNVLSVVEVKYSVLGNQTWHPYEATGRIKVSKSLKIDLTLRSFRLNVRFRAKYALSPFFRSSSAAALKLR